MALLILHGDIEVIGSISTIAEQSTAPDRFRSARPSLRLQRRVSLVVMMLCAAAVKNRTSVTIPLMSFLDLDEGPQGDEATKWVGGILAPLPFVIYGLLCVINRAGAVPGRGKDSTPLLGIDAVILGVACLSFASSLHFHYYWGLSESLKDHYEYGKFASIVVLIFSLGWVAWCLLRGFGELY